MSNIYLKKALASDSDFFHCVRNNPKNREQSLSTKEIAFSDHDIWFQNKISSPWNHYFVIISSEFPVGYVRLDHQPAKGKEVSIALLPEYQGKKIGQKALILAVDIAKSNSLLPLFANVKVENLASSHVFKTAGFIKLDEVANDFQVFKYDNIN